MRIEKVTSDGTLAWYRRGEQNIFLADAVDATADAAMTVGFARYGRDESNEWTVSYDEALIITKGRFTVRTAERSLSAGSGEVLYLYAGTPLVYVAEEDTELVYVTYPHWTQATLDSPHADKLTQFQPVDQAS
ncbi:cupin [Cryptosporangium aurantiacum]|uniref:Ethanolamine utilization protein EutQ n=1 Tax=Cryptosporangium aurantiacum TaxID=134849 RepID=A0A1M7R354_9ACTN|nr:cupin [Cryptosporangium aurantiacum]SHN39267.1 ethanolamine utilization protein EutQ [Cryptosporangium aurantiacum]